MQSQVRFSQGFQVSHFAPDDIPSEIFTGISRKSNAPGEITSEISQGFHVSQMLPMISRMKICSQGFYVSQMLAAISRMVIMMMR